MENLSTEMVRFKLGARLDVDAKLIKIRGWLVRSPGEGEVPCVNKNEDSGSLATDLVY
jgi:hypothetical protein